MQERYLSLSPYNLVRLILGKREPADSESSNVYTRAAAYLKEWTAAGVLVRDSAPGIFPYSQEFKEPDTGERLVRQGFIALGKVEDYFGRHRASARADAIRPQERPGSSCCAIRMRISAKSSCCIRTVKGAVDALLAEASKGAPLAEITDEYGAVHRIWKLAAARARRARADVGQEAADRRRPPPLRGPR